MVLSSPGSAGFNLEPQPINDRLVGLGFPHRQGRCLPGGLHYSSPGRRIGSDMEGFQNRGRRPIVPRWRWVYFRAQPISDWPVGQGNPHRPVHILIVGVERQPFIFDATESIDEELVD